MYIDQPFTIYIAAYIYKVHIHRSMLAACTTSALVNNTNVCNKIFDMRHDTRHTWLQTCMHTLRIVDI
jgi:hypothetical protein